MNEKIKKLKIINKMKTEISLRNPKPNEEFPRQNKVFWERYRHQ